MLADMQVLVRHIRRLAGPNRYAGLNDRALLECFAREGNQDAFAALVNRHAHLVAGVCYRVLGDSHDVEDVFQTTFLTLARKAGTVGWRASVANWLFGVAHRQSLRARANRRRRQALNEAARENVIVQEADAQKRDLQQMLDAELGGLGERFRLPLILCYLEGRTRDEAARQCGWSLRTLERRLEQGRGLLRNRFLRRGVDLSVVLMAAAMAEKQANASGQLIAKTLSAVRTSVSTGALAAPLTIEAARTSSAATGYLKLAGGLAMMLTVAALGSYAWSGRSGAESELTSTEANIPALPPEERQDKPTPLAATTPQSTPRMGSSQFRASGLTKVQYSSDGTRIVAVGPQGLEVFNAVTGLIILRAKQPGPAVSGTLAISGDGALAFLADPTGKYQGDIFPTDSGFAQCRLQVPDKRAIKRAAFSRENRFLAGLVNETSVDLYDTYTGRFVRTIEWKENFPRDEKQPHLGEIGFLPDGQSMIVSGHLSGVIRVFDFTTGQETRQISVSPKGMDGMILSPDGQTLVAFPNALGPTSGGLFLEQSDGTTLVLSTATGKELNKFVITPGFPLASTPDAENKNLLSPYYPRVFSPMLAIGPDNKTLFAGGSKTARTGIGRWDLATGAYLGSVALPWPHPNDMPIAISPNGKTLLCFCDSTLHQIDIATGRHAIEPSGHLGPISSVAISSKHYVTGSEDGKVMLWDRATGNLLFEVGEPARSVRKILLDHEGGRLFVLYSGRNASVDDVNLRAYRISDGKMIWETHPPRREHLLEGAANLAVNGNQLAVLNSDSIASFQAETGRFVHQDSFSSTPAQPLPALAGTDPSPTASMYARDKGELLIWNQGRGINRVHWILDLEWPAPLQKRATPIDTITTNAGSDSTIGAFSPDGQFLALAGPKSGINLFNSSTGRWLNSMEWGNNTIGPRIGFLVFSPNSKQLAWVPEHSGFVNLTDVSTGKATNSEAFSTRITALAYSDDGKSLIVGFGDSTANVLDLPRQPAAK